jgi:phosphopantetheinyl transferase
MRESTGELEVPALMNLWVAKEAALKAAGSSSLTMTNLRVRAAQLDGRYILVDLDSEAGAAVRAVCLRSHNCFYAVATETRDTQ